MIREARESDMHYFVWAGAKFTGSTPYQFDEDVYTESVKAILSDPQCIVRVNGDPAEGHCAARISPSMYGRQLICRVFSTWGKGGLKCFDAVSEIAKARGCSVIIADAYIDERIKSFYRRRGMRSADELYIGSLWA